ncbi:CRISPR-associated endonuclease Cas2 [Zhenpiania hominis]|uniref:CRISPR-associated endoribonuclease Cas2 n=1 Tax=Zhenpiania hominis TaxID=2763644 RepID=A0A923NNA4_9FIRM|nr:CRISPR-associated endonuclease Cas2 [Zhenpiania hominis]
MVEENYIFKTEEIEKTKKYLVMVCYDITDNKRRLKMVRLLEHYLFRVQKSVFEGMLEQKTYRKLKEELEHFTREDENIRLYKISGTGDVCVLGNAVTLEEDEIIII